MSFENPASILFNAEGIELAVTDSQSLTGSGIQPGIIVAGSSSTGEVHFMRVSDDGSVFVTGALSTTIDPNTLVAQGNAGTQGEGWYVRITDGTQVLGTGSSAPIYVSGAVDISNPVTITDGGGSITVDGTVTANVTGTVALDRGDSTSNPLFISGTVTTDGPTGFQADPIYVTGSFTANFDPAPTATVTPVSSTVGIITLQEANIERRGLTVFNESKNNMYLKLGVSASATSFTVKVGPRGYYEVPANYIGLVTATWSSADGFAYVTEILN